MKELERLKRQLLKQEPSEQDFIRRLCQVMEIVGGYDNLMNLPMPALYQIFEYINYTEKKSQDQYDKIKIKGKKKW